MSSYSQKSDSSKYEGEELELEQQRRCCAHSCPEKDEWSHRGSALMHDEPLSEQDVVREPTEGSPPLPDDRRRGGALGDYLTSCRKADRQGSPHWGSALMHDEPLLEQDVVREPTEGSPPPPDDRR